MRKNNIYCDCNRSKPVILNHQCIDHPYVRKLKTRVSELEAAISNLTLKVEAMQEAQPGRCPHGLDLNVCLRLGPSSRAESRVTWQDDVLRGTNSVGTLGVSLYHYYAKAWQMSFQETTTSLSMFLPGRRPDDDLVKRTQRCTRQVDSGRMPDANGKTMMRPLPPVAQALPRLMPTFSMRARVDGSVCFSSYVHFTSLTRGPNRLVTLSFVLSFFLVFETQSSWHL